MPSAPSWPPAKHGTPKAGPPSASTAPQHHEPPAKAPPWRPPPPQFPPPPGLSLPTSPRVKAPPPKSSQMSRTGTMPQPHHVTPKPAASGAASSSVAPQQLTHAEVANQLSRPPRSMSLSLSHSSVKRLLERTPGVRVLHTNDVERLASIHQSMGETMDCLRDLAASLDRDHQALGHILRKLQ